MVACRAGPEGPYVDATVGDCSLSLVTRGRRSDWLNWVGGVEDDLVAGGAI